MPPDTNKQENESTVLGQFLLSDEGVNSSDERAVAVIVRVSPAWPDGGERDCTTGGVSQQVRSPGHESAVTLPSSTISITAICTENCIPLKSSLPNAELGVSCAGVNGKGHRPWFR
jgi:hypothetical protein